MLTISAVQALCLRPLRRHAVGSNPNSQHVPLVERRLRQAGSDRIATEDPMRNVVAAVAVHHRQFRIIIVLELLELAWNIAQFGKAIFRAVQYFERVR